MLHRQRTIDSASSRVNIFDVFANDIEEDDQSHFDETRKDRMNEYEPMSPRKNAELHEWLATSYYGTIHKVPTNTVIPINYPKIDNVLCCQEAENYCDTKSEQSNIEDETNSLFNPIIQTDKLSTTVEDNEYAVCRDCKSRYTRNRTTRYARITWITLSCFLLSISLFPWGLLSAIFVVFIPYQIRRPTCKKCRNTGWGF